MDMQSDNNHRSVNNETHLCFHSCLFGQGEKLEEAWDIDEHQILRCLSAIPPVPREIQ